jgi:hypothetical protein
MSSTRHSDRNGDSSWITSARTFLLLTTTAGADQRGGRQVVFLSVGTQGHAGTYRSDYRGGKAPRYSKTQLVHSHNRARPQPKILTNIAKNGNRLGVLIGEQ